MKRLIICVLLLVATMPNVIRAQGQLNTKEITEASTVSATDEILGNVNDVTRRYKLSAVVTLFGSYFLPSNTQYTPSSRVLTINGISYDMSSNRSWSIPFVGPPSGLTQAGATVGQVLQWNGAAWIPATIVSSFDTSTLNLNNRLALKVDKSGSKQLSTEDYTTAEKGKLSGIATGATNVTLLSQLAGDATHRTVTDAEKATWNSGTGGSSYSAGTGISINGSNVISLLDERYTTAEKSKLTGVAIGATNVTLLSQLGADATHRTVTDAEKATWNAAAGGTGISQLNGDVIAGPGVGNVSAALSPTGVAAGSYTNANMTVDSKGRVLSISNGTAANGGLTATKIIDSVQQFYTMAKDTTLLVYVKDLIRTNGRAFVWKPTGAKFIDSAITYPAASGNGVWSMINPGSKYYITWFGAVPNDSSKDATRFVQKAIDRAFADSIYLVGVPKGRFYIKGDIPPVYVSDGSPAQNDTLLEKYLPYQIQIPVEKDFGSQKRITIEGDFEGASSSPLSALSSAPGFQSGCVFESTIRPSSSRDGAVIGCRAYVGSFNTVSYSALKIQNLIILVSAGTTVSPQQATMSAIDATYASQANIDNVTVGTNIPYDLTSQPSNNTTGIKMPHVLNFATSILGNVRAYAFFTGIALGEHTLGEYLTVIGCYNGVTCQNTGHRISVNKLQVEGTRNSINMNDQGEGLYIASFGEEKGGQNWSTNVYTVETANGFGHFTNRLFISHYVNSGTLRMRVNGNPDYVSVAYSHDNDVINGFAWETNPDQYGNSTNYIDALYCRNLNLVATTNQTLGIKNLQTGQTGTILFKQNSGGTKTLTLPSGVTNFAGTSIPVVTEAGYAISATPNSITTVKYRFDGTTLRFSTL